MKTWKSQSAAPRYPTSFRHLKPLGVPAARRATRLAYMWSRGMVCAFTTLLYMTVCFYHLVYFIITIFFDVFFFIPVSASGWVCSGKSVWEIHQELGKSQESPSTRPTKAWLDGAPKINGVHRLTRTSPSWTWGCSSNCKWIYIYKSIHIYIYIHIYIFVYLHIYIYTYMYMYIYIYL